MNPRFEVAPEYIKRHYYPEDRLAIVLIERATGRVQQELHNARDLASDRVQAHLRASNAHGHDIYATVNTLREGATGRTKADIDQIRHVYLDVDSGGRPAVERILQADRMPQPHSIMETSPGKSQMLWQVEGFNPAQAEKLTQELATVHNADQAVWDSARVLRVPGFRNCKYEEPHYVRMESGGAQRVYTREDFPRYEIERPQPVFGERQTTQNPTRGGSQSEKDWAEVLYRLERNHDPTAIERDLATKRREMNAAGGPYKPHPEQYAKRTVENAIRDISRSVSTPSRLEPERESLTRQWHSR